MSTRFSDEIADARQGEITYFTTKDFDKSIAKAFLAGGQQQKKAVKVKAVLGSLRDENPFVGLSVTDHGETRISKCVKYKLDDSWRLVTTQDGKTCTFLFMGDHEDVDRWLDRNIGLRLAVKNLKTILLPGSGEVVRERLVYADHHDEPLAELLEPELMDYVLSELPRSLSKKLEALNGRSTTRELGSLILEVAESNKAELVRAVFNLLLLGDQDGARAHVELRMGRIESLEDVNDSQMLDVIDGEDVRRLRIGSSEYEAWLAAFEKRSHWYEWFLYLHPEQEKVVNADYTGPAQLSGVSGSGKTCVAVRRALRLSESPEAKVLLLTLNRSLARLLGHLVDAACVDESQRRRIEVTSFFELAQRLLQKFEPENYRLFADVTWKLDEHVDEVFREYYRQWANNDAAKALLPLHKSITGRGVAGEVYLREEFDWIRSAVSPNARAKYLDLERKGRKFGIPVDRRADVLLGLDGWERKMRDVGVIDYLGLTSALSSHLDRIEPLYTNVLVDEAQDFGTTELRVVRNLVKSGDNDIFLCGDIAQTILPKHRALPEAGITVVTRERIVKNYRNGREILKAAYEVLTNNLHEDLFDKSDLEILDPAFANFTGNVPMALAADTLEEEIAYARTYARTALGNYAKNVCIAFAGFSSRDISSYAKRCGVTALDGIYDPSSDQLVFCDLEQSKGYEFDTMIIVNSRDGVLPPHDAPEEEAYRSSCKLYVAMTRAKRELILSFHDKASPWIVDVTDTIGTGTWSDTESLDPELLQGVPELLPEIEPDGHVADVGKLTGLQFIYTAQALGLSPEAQDRLVDLVDGRGTMRAAIRGMWSGGRRLKWVNMRSIMEDLRSGPRNDPQVGPAIAKELRKLSSAIR